MPSYVRVILLMFLLGLQVVDVKFTQHFDAITDQAESNVIVKTLESHSSWNVVMGAKMFLVVGLAACWRYRYFDRVLTFILSIYVLLTFYHFILLYVTR